MNRDDLLKLFRSEGFTAAIRAALDTGDDQLVRYVDQLDRERSPEERQSPVRIVSIDAFGCLHFGSTRDAAIRSGAEAARNYH